MVTIRTDDPVAETIVAAIRQGNVDQVRRLLVDHPELAQSRLGDGGPEGTSRSLLHVATDWPGHFPRVASTIAVLVEAGADVNARFRGPHQETPVHWAASSGDLDALVALLDLGADIEAAGGVIAGGTALGDATAFGQWEAARTLVARGARASTFDLAALGMVDDLVAAIGPPGPDRARAINEAFWSACHGNQLAAAEALVSLGAEIDFLPGWEAATPLDIAVRAGANDVVGWLRGHGAHTSAELGVGES
jgi:ankyrin repeat protein